MNKQDRTPLTCSTRGRRIVKGRPRILHARHYLQMLFEGCLADAMLNVSVNTSTGYEEEED